MRALKDEKTDAVTKKAWEKNWVDIYHPILVTAAFLALLGWTLGRG